MFDFSAKLLGALIAAAVCASGVSGQSLQRGPEVPDAERSGQMRPLGAPWTPPKMPELVAPANMPRRPAPGVAPRPATAEDLELSRRYSTVKVVRGPIDCSTAASKENCARVNAAIGNCAEISEDKSFRLCVARQLPLLPPAGCEALVERSARATCDEQTALAQACKDLVGDGLAACVVKVQSGRASAVPVPRSSYNEPLNLNVRVGK